MNLRVTVSGQVKEHEFPSRSESEPEEGVRVLGGRRETERSTHVQVEVPVTRNGGPNG